MVTLHTEYFIISLNDLYYDEYIAKLTLNNYVAYLHLLDLNLFKYKKHRVCSINVYDTTKTYIKFCDIDNSMLALLCKDRLLCGTA